MLQRDLQAIDVIRQTDQPARIPVVLTLEEVRAILPLIADTLQLTVNCCTAPG